VAHMQQQVLDALETALKAADTPAGTRWFVDRTDPFRVADLPAVVIEEAPQGEQSEPFSIQSHDQRQLFVDIRCFLKLTDDHAAAAREFGLKVEKAIASNQALRRTVKQARILGSFLERSTEGEFQYAARVLRYRFTYIVHPTAPDVAL
jgi:hypothetical protein